jgi:muramoyltetrapeptide carboxypeptidase
MNADRPMRRLLFTLLTITAAAPAASAEEPWLKAPALRAGDTIAFVAPAGPPERERVEKCKRRLEALGFRVSVPDNLYRRDRYLAGSDDERAAEFNAALHDPHVRAIFPCRGGYGLTRILARLDYAALKKAPKIITGYSDLTALHLAIAKQARLITFHAPMPESALWREEARHAFAERLFWRALLAERYKGASGAGYTIDLPTDQPAPTRLVGGKAAGRLVGGNLTLVCATLGTPYALEAKGNLLFLEDTGEAPYRVDRMFSQLRLAGVLDEVAGIILGSFDNTDVLEVERVIRGYCAQLKVPVLMHFPVGHTAFNATLPHGARAELDADAGRVRVLEDPVILSER